MFEQRHPEETNLPIVKLVSCTWSEVLASSTSQESSGGSPGCLASCSSPLLLCPITPKKNQVENLTMRGKSEIMGKTPQTWQGIKACSFESKAQRITQRNSLQGIAFRRGLVESKDKNILGTKRGKKVTDHRGKNLQGDKHFIRTLGHQKILFPPVLGKKKKKTLNTESHTQRKHPSGTTTTKKNHDICK